MVRSTELWKVDLETAEGSRHEFRRRDPFKMVTAYARFTETGGSCLLEMTSRLWNQPPWYSVWNADSVTPVQTKTDRMVAHLKVLQKKQSNWVLDNMGERLCRIPEEYCSKLGGGGFKTQCNISHDRLAVLNEDGTLLAVKFHPMMEYLRVLS
jgi:hypothetical protein